MVESSKQVQPWRDTIAWHIHATPADRRAHWPLSGGVSLWLDFIMPRPTRTPKTNTPPAVKKPDLDKLARAALDAIDTAEVYHDDSQVTHLRCTKRLASFGEQPGLYITIEPEEN